MSLMAEAWALSMTTVVCPFCCCEPMSPLHLGPTLVARLYRVILCIVRSEYFWKTCRNLFNCAAYQSSLFRPKPKIL
ncbi:hypothetical protein F5051DRAFT_398976 [Lentinula edodes]|nr:hypothetical protein F5051DRAFT_398976 [Lentinula edodes]